MARNSVETQYDASAPWKGLGANVEKARTTKELLKLAGLDWAVKKEPLVIESGVKVKDHFALIRSSDDSTLDVVGSRYIPTQHLPTFEFLDEFIREGQATLETAGALNKGRVVWALAKLNQTFKLPGNDKVQGYLFVGIPHMQGRSLIVRVTSLRDVCNNTLSIALRTTKRGGISDVFRMNHRNAFDEAQMTKAKETIGLAREQFSDFENQARRLSKTKMDTKTVIKTLQPIFQPHTPYRELITDMDLLNIKMRTILDANKNAPGAQPDTAWGVLNAVTYYADHVASRTPDKRLTHAWTGRTMKQKEQTLTALLELA